MNKTSKRAAQKHRANTKRYALRRKADAGQQVTASSKTKGPAGTATAARARATAKHNGENPDAETA